VLIGTARGVSLVDAVSRQLVWEYAEGESNRGVALWSGLVIWGDTSPFSTVYALDAATGREHWRAVGPGAYLAAPVVDSAGTLYINDAEGVIYARQVSDGALRWRTDLAEPILSSPSVSGLDLLVSSREWDLVRLEQANGNVRWVFPTSREIRGTAAIAEDRVYAASEDKSLYCIDSKSGTELWRFDCRAINPGAVALGHNGTIYTTTSAANILWAVTPEGEELWHFVTGGGVFNAPIVAGDGSVYLCAQANNPERGFVHAVKADGTELWTMEMERHVTASPMLGPDGTLYVVSRDKNLYAFRDVAGDLDHDGDIDLADLGTLGDCLTGPRIWGTRALTPPGCELLDFDRDWDVDVADFARIQIELSAP
jgi:outer membrane protein assembly factor BamB